MIVIVHVGCARPMQYHVEPARNAAPLQARGQRGPVLEVAVTGTPLKALRIQRGLIGALERTDAFARVVKAPDDAGATLRAGLNCQNVAFWLDLEECKVVFEYLRPGMKALATEYSWTGRRPAAPDDVRAVELEQAVQHLVQFLRNEGAI